MLQEFLDPCERCFMNVHASVLSHRGGGAGEDLDNPPSTGGVLARPPSPCHPAVYAKDWLDGLVPSGGSRPTVRTKRTKAKEAPTDGFRLSPYQRGYAQESKGATLWTPASLTVTTGPEISCKGVCMMSRVPVSLRDNPAGSEKM